LSILALSVDNIPAWSKEVETLLLGIEECMRGIPDFEGNAKLLKVRINPVALVEESCSSLGKGTDLIIVASVEKNVKESTRNTDFLMMIILSCRINS